MVYFVYEVVYILYPARKYDSFDKYKEGIKNDRDAQAMYVGYMVLTQM